MIEHAISCPTCRDSGRILCIYERGPGSPPGNAWIGCPDCPAGRTYDAALKAEMAPRCMMCGRPEGAACPNATPEGCPLDVALEQSYRLWQQQSEQAAAAAAASTAT